MCKKKKKRISIPINHSPAKLQKLNQSEINSELNWIKSI